MDGKSHSDTLCLTIQIIHIQHIHKKYYISVVYTDIDS